MQTSPYSLYVHKRPLRTAFFIGVNVGTFGILDKVFEYCRDKWGGRYNPIVLTDGQSLTTSSWAILEDFDPDMLVTFVPLGEGLLADIARRLAPLHIQPIPENEQTGNVGRLHLRYSGLSYLPTPLNDSVPFGGFIKRSLVLLKTHYQKTDPLVRRFVEWNFGEFNDPIQSVSQALEGVPKVEFEITDWGSLVGPLKELSTFKSFVYPIQICSTPTDALPVMADGHFGEMFHVVIGDSPSDVAYFWNLQATVPTWKRLDLNQVWLPKGVATDPRMIAALSGWIQRQADPGGSGRGHVRFVSTSLSQIELQQIATPLFQGLRVGHVETALTSSPNLVREEPHRGLEKMDRYPLTGIEETIRLQAPSIHSGPNLDEYSMADLFVEFRPERYPTIHRQSLWWQFPRLNLVVSGLFTKPTRVLRERFPSALIRREESEFGLSLPSDLNLFRGLGTLPHHPRDPRITDLDVTPRRRPYRYLKPSDKGGYLSGVLELYGGLHPATGILESRFWRKMFDIMSGKTSEKDEQVSAAVENKLKRKLESNPAEFYQREDGMKWLVKYLINLSRSQSTTSREINFQRFEENAQKEMDEFKAGRSDSAQWAYSKEALLRSMRDLTDRGVLKIGIKGKCPSCGYSVWYHIDEMKQTLVCRGCNANFPMRPEPTWYYQMNSLARSAHADHGLLPVILVLGQMLVEARSSFMFAPCLDLLDGQEAETQVGDLDIAVILDGLFVIGEVKQSVSLFSPSVFETMEEVAKRLQPDRVIFSSLDAEPNATVRAGIDKLKASLEPLGIDVCWYPLHRSDFEPAPVR